MRVTLHCIARGTLLNNDAKLSSRRVLNLKNANVCEPIRGLSDCFHGVNGRIQFQPMLACLRRHTSKAVPQRQNLTLPPIGWSSASYETNENYEMSARNATHELATRSQPPGQSSSRLMSCRHHPFCRRSATPQGIEAPCSRSDRFGPVEPA